MEWYTAGVVNAIKESKSRRVLLIIYVSGSNIMLKSYGRISCLIHFSIGWAIDNRTKDWIQSSRDAIYTVLVYVNSGPFHLCSCTCGIVEELHLQKFLILQMSLVFSLRVIIISYSLCQHKFVYPLHYHISEYHKKLCFLRLDLELQDGI